MDEITHEPVLEPHEEENPSGGLPPPYAGEEDALLAEQPARAAPALTIHIQSWATPIVGVVMLVVGLLAGYFGRPALDPPVTQVPATESSSSTSSQAAPEDQAAQQQALMEAVLPRVRHFKGDEAAPLTLLEFSDFQ